ncbi:acyltransferase family protein [Paracoccus salsus]|uniref:acyltransferase family protein n=1 Tax=Paracoccus salsus TaxID=2911061 RepID=UPI001F1D74CD|nr:acyltransferase [Paracoccus salsus]MCF3974433.1 acyltransferase [Paracoccus salsus]
MIQDRVYSIDYMRAILAAFVVIGHSGLGRETFGSFGLIVLSIVLRHAVPLFAMTAGYFLFRTQQKARYWLWVQRILLIYVAWYLIYFVFMQLWQQATTQNLREFLLGFRHLWFLEGLVVAACMMALVIPRGPRAMLLSAVAFGSIGLVLQYASIGHLVPVPLEVFRSGPFFLYPFMVMGYLFAQKMSAPQSVPWAIPGRGVLIAALLTGLVLALCENLVFLTVVNRYAILEFQAGLFLMAPAIFALTLRVSVPASGLPLGRIASAVYVIHYLFLHFASEMQVSHPLVPTLVAFFAPALMVVAMVRIGRGQRWLAQLF